MAIIINDVTLPDIPSDVLASYPYAAVLSSVDSSEKKLYILAVSNSSVFHGNGSVLGQNAEEGVGSFGAGAIYYVELGGNAWTSVGAVDAGEFVTALGVVNGMTLSFVWSNHDVRELTSFDPTTGEYTTGSIWFAKSVEGSYEELIATHFYYNTVLLPEIPSEVLKTHPYCWIRNNTQTGHYDLLMSSSPWWKSDPTTITTVNYAEGIQWYRVVIPGPGDEWNFNQSWTENGNFAVDTNRPIMWSNHNVPVGSVSASEIYFHGSTPIPVVESYDIRRDSLAGIANQVRRLCGTSESLTPARMKARLGGLNIELQAAHVTSSDEEQVIYPDEGYYGFSSITVAAVEDSGSIGGGGTPGGGDGGDGETETPVSNGDNIAFGNNYTEQTVYTGMAIYPTSMGDVKLPPPVGDAYKIISYSSTYGYHLYTAPVRLYATSVGGSLTRIDEEHCNYYALDKSGTEWVHQGVWAVAPMPRWTNHNICSKDGTTVYHPQSGNYTLEATTAIVPTPVECAESYEVSSESLNSIVGTAQKLTNSTEPMTLTEAAEALAQYAEVNGFT